MTWTAQTWLPVAVPWPLGPHHRLKFAHLRTLLMAPESCPKGCLSYGHTLWSCVNSDQAIGIGWEWAVLDGTVRCLALANPLGIVSNLRFMDLQRNCYLNEREALLPLNTLVGHLDWQIEVARHVDLELSKPHPSDQAQEPAQRYYRKVLVS